LKVLISASSLMLRERKNSFLLLLFSGGNLSVSGECTCSACPHKAELERIEGFYRDVFHL